jgi:hypothetical protein
MTNEHYQELIKLAHNNAILHRMLHQYEHDPRTTYEDFAHTTIVALVEQNAAFLKLGVDAITRAGPPPMFMRKK